MDLISGNIFVRPNFLNWPGALTPRHLHNFDHTTFVRTGWILIRIEKKDGTESIVQIASPEFTWLRSLLLKYEPHKVPRPIRFPDTVDETGRKKFVITFIKQGEDVPEGGEEILYSENLRWFELIEASSKHELVNLAHKSIFDCTYSHRNAQGDIIQQYKEWQPSYE